MSDNKVINDVKPEEKVMIMINSAKESLDKLFEENDRVFIVQHKEPDMDAIGAAIGMSLILKKKKKKSYIVVDEPIEKNAKKFIEETNGEFEYISSNQLPGLLTDKNLLIALDVNPKNRISVGDYLDKFNSIFILDHHSPNDLTIDTPYKFIDESLSSTCEAISLLLKLYRIKLETKYANYLYAGIRLDTKNFTRNISTALTHKVDSKLQQRGVNIQLVEKWFKKSEEEDRIIQELTSNTVVYPYTFAVACSNREDKIYAVEDLAKAADNLINYDFSASFVIARVAEDMISISARSRGDINVGNIMKLFGGGGGKNAAGARIMNQSLENVNYMLSQLLIPYNIVDEQKKENSSEEKDMNLKLVFNNKTTD